MLRDLTQEEVTRFAGMGVTFGEMERMDGSAPPPEPPPPSPPTPPPPPPPPPKEAGGD